MGRKKTQQDLGRRERQIIEIVYQLGEASVADVLERLPDPPSYSAVRTMIRLVESKGFLRHRREGMRYIYRPTQSKESARRLALRQLLKTYFGGSASDAMAAMLDVSSEKLSEKDLDRIERIVRNARKEGR